MFQCEFEESAKGRQGRIGSLTTEELLDALHGIGQKFDILDEGGQIEEWVFYDRKVLVKVFTLCRVKSTENGSPLGRYRQVE